MTVYRFVFNFGAMSGKCESCSIKTLTRLDFSDLKDNVDKDELEAILSYIPEDDEEDGEDDIVENNNS